MAQQLGALAVCAGPRFVSQHSFGNSKVSGTLVLGDLLPSDLQAPGIHVLYIQTCRQNSYGHEIKINLKYL